MVNQKETNKGGFCPYESVVLVLEKMRKERVASASQQDGPAAFQYRLLGVCMFSLCLILWYIAANKIMCEKCCCIGPSGLACTCQSIFYYCLDSLHCYAFLL